MSDAIRTRKVSISATGVDAKIEVDGQNVTKGLTAATLKLSAGQRPQLALEILANEVEIEGDMIIRLAERARSALLAIGWAPPVDDPTDIHTFFGLSYSNYLVLHRTLLQSMPENWQHRFVAMVQELQAAFAHVETAPYYEVTPAREVEYGYLSAVEMRRLGVTRSDGEEGRGGDVVYHDRVGSEHESWERALLPIGDDPVPHYNRGRTRIEPHLAAKTAN